MLTSTILTAIILPDKQVFSEYLCNYKGLMKIAITGKGGVGKTTIVALMARILRDTGFKVLAIDADPDMNLATVLGVPPAVNIIPIVELKELIAERTGTEPGKSAPFFKLNPKVDDIPDKYCIEHKGIKLITMGTIKKGGGGCACPESTFLRNLLSHLILERKEWGLLDMEAGIEHLGRGTARGVDLIIIVVEPSQVSIQTAYRIKKLAGDIDLTNIKIIGNKIQNSGEKKFLKESTKDFDFLGFIGYDEGLKNIDIKNISALETEGSSFEQMKQIANKIVQDT